MVQVQVKQGILEGIQCISVLASQIYYSFLGIPFAKPPVGELRFRAPQPPENWTGVRQANKEGPPCIQFNPWISKILGDEDCLYLNVYTPEDPSKITTPKAVIVYIHGGGFTVGSSSTDELSPDFLVIQDVVIVTIQYRLHALGFLNIASPNRADLNCGLKDQNMALKWITENIKAFGGDCDNITLFGESAGAISTYMHMVSPASNGLFHKTILQSGIYILPRSINEQPQKSAFELANKLGYKENDASKLVDYLKKISQEDFCKMVSEMEETGRKNHTLKTNSLIFLPSVETNKDNAFLPDYPFNLAKKAKPLPTMAGFNNKEGRLIYAIWPTGKAETYRDKLSELIADSRPQYSTAKITEITPKVKKFYFGEKEITEEQKEPMIDLFTDLAFISNFYESLDYIVTSESPLYIYDFQFYGKLNTLSNTVMKDDHITDGAGHADEIPYIFYAKGFVKNSNMVLQEPETKTIDNMTKLWTNFAKTNNPTNGMTNVTWKPHKKNDPNHLTINTDLTLKLINEKLYKNRYEFWNSIE